MNRENIRKTIDHIRNSGVQFDMNVWWRGLVENECDTVCCIGGHAAIACYDQLPPNAPICGNSGMIALGLSREQAEELFTPDSDLPCDPYNASAEDAIRVLEYLLDTGEVDWTILDGSHD